MLKGERKLIQLVNIHQRNFAAAAQKTIKLTNIRQLAGFRRDDSLVKETDVELLIVGKKIAKFGKNLPDQADETIDTNGALVTPGFVDPHTHIFPPQDRSHEYAYRGIKTSATIKAEGGGILSSVRSAREATFEQLFEVNEKNVQRFIQLGTTTLEMKSGYGLDMDTEIKLLEVIKALKKKYAKFIDIVPTFLGAHDFPPEMRGDKEKEKEYVNFLIKEMIPKVRKLRLAEFVDVFCEKGYFSDTQAQKILKKALKRKLKIRVHADEYEDSGAAQIAGLLKAHSADHLMAISDLGIKQLKEGGTVATILPGTTVHLGLKQFAPVRKMIEAGVRVAVGTDYNPGTCVFNNQALMMNFAIGYGHMTIYEAFAAVTRNAALALGRENVGIIDEDAQADLLIWNGIFDIVQIPYYNAESHRFINKVIKNGKVLNLKKFPKK